MLDFFMLVFVVVLMYCMDSTSVSGHDVEVATKTCEKAEGVKHFDVSSYFGTKSCSVCNSKQQATTITWKCDSTKDDLR